MFFKRWKVELEKSFYNKVVHKYIRLIPIGCLDGWKWAEDRE